MALGAPAETPGMGAEMLRFGCRKVQALTVRVADEAGSGGKDKQIQHAKPRGLTALRVENVAEPVIRVRRKCLDEVSTVPYELALLAVKDGDGPLETIA